MRIYAVSSKRLAASIAASCAKSSIAIFLVTGTCTPSLLIRLDLIDIFQHYGMIPELNWT